MALYGPQKGCCWIQLRSFTLASTTGLRSKLAVSWKTKKGKVLKEKVKKVLGKYIRKRR